MSWEIIILSLGLGIYGVCTLVIVGCMFHCIANNHDGESK